MNPLGINATFTPSQLAGINGGGNGGSGGAASITIQGDATAEQEADCGGCSAIPTGQDKWEK